MGFFGLFLIAVSLSMDAFAVSICKGLSMKKMSYKNAGIVGLFFGGFQAIMPLIGYLLGTQFKGFITPVDHWITFVLLAVIGIKMIREAKECCPVSNGTLDIKDLTMMAFATSVDALAVGITFAFLQITILPAVVLIGLTTFILSFLGVKIGNVFGSRFQSKAQIAGGIILILMGLKILLEHLGIINF